MGVTDWMTIRVVLTSGRGNHLDTPPGRLFLVHADHAFAELAEALDATFGRWDTGPVHEFDVEGRRLILGGGPEDFAEGVEPEDSEEVTLGEVGLRLGARFSYVFDPTQRWTHDCIVTGVDVDPYDIGGEEPERPAPVMGWGALPDQYGRMREADDPDGGVVGLADADEPLQDVLEDSDVEEWDEDEEAFLASWREAEQTSWDIVEEALAEIPRERPGDEIAAAHTRLRAARHADHDDWRIDVLWAAAGFDDEGPPDDAGEFWLELAAGVVSPSEPLPMDPDEEAAWASLEPADWAGAVIELVRAGVGVTTTPEALLDLVAACPEVDNDDLGVEDEQVLMGGFATVVDLWSALGVLDDEGRLTALGLWGLPEALRLAWTEI